MSLTTDDAFSCDERQLSSSGMSSSARIMKSNMNNYGRKNILNPTSFNSSRSNSFRRLSQLKFQAKNDTTKELKSGDQIQREGRSLKINSDKKVVSTRSQQSITKMLLLISSVFVLLNLPSYGIRLYVFIFFSLWKESPPVLLWCIQQIFMTLFYTNFSINFLLYSMCGMTFRRCLWQLVRKKMKKISIYQCRKPAENKGF